MIKAIVAGHVCLDLVPALSRPVDVAPGALVEIGALVMRSGGCVANAGAALTDLGAEVRSVADTGDDELGAVLRRLLAEGGAEVSLVEAVPGTTTSYSIVIEPPGRDRSFWHHVGANATFDGQRVDLSGGDALHVGYPTILPAMVADEAAALTRLFRRAMGAGLVTSLDLAVLPHDGDAAPVDWTRTLRGVASLVDILSPSIDDLASMAVAPPDRSIDALSSAAANLVRQGVAVVALTAGESGLLVRTGTPDRMARSGRALAALESSWADRELWLTAPRVPVASTRGTGDAASAGLLYGLLAGLSIEQAGVLAVTCGALRARSSDPLPRFHDQRTVRLDGIQLVDRSKALA